MLVGGIAQPAREQMEIDELPAAQEPCRLDALGMKRSDRRQQPPERDVVLRGGRADAQDTTRVSRITERLAHEGAAHPAPTRGRMHQHGQLRLVAGASKPDRALTDEELSAPGQGLTEELLPAGQRLPLKVLGAAERGGRRGERIQDQRSKRWRVDGLGHTNDHRRTAYQRPLMLRFWTRPSSSPARYSSLIGSPAARTRLPRLPPAAPAPPILPSTWPPHEPSPESGQRRPGSFVQRWFADAHSPTRATVR